MGLFSSKDDSKDQPTITGIDVLRREIYAKTRASGGATFLAICARECKVDGRSLEQFAAGEIVLSDERLNNLARYLFNGATYNATTQLLERPAEGPIRATHTYEPLRAQVRDIGCAPFGREPLRTTPLPSFSSQKPYDWFGQRPGWAERAPVLGSTPAIDAK
jgi:hypothetical protein